MTNPSPTEALLLAVEEVDNAWSDDEGTVRWLPEFWDRVVALRRAYNDFEDAALAAEPRSDVVTAPDPEADNAPCGCGAIGVAAHTNVEHYAVTAPDEPHRDYAGRTCTTGLMHAHAAPDEPSTLAALQRMADPLDAVVVTRRAWREARAASASVPPPLERVIELEEALRSLMRGERGSVGKAKRALYAVEAQERPASGEAVK